MFVTLSASIAPADVFKTINGKEYKGGSVSRVETDGIVLDGKSGIVKVYFTELPKEVADKWRADPVFTADAAAEQKRIEAEKAAEQKAEKAAEQERTEKQSKADAELKRAVEQFEVAEQRASKAYDSAVKGTLSGQVFVSTKGGENFKLGAVQVDYSLAMR